ncbi:MULTISPECIES: trehalose-phosphatase [Streptomyces]|uniref:Trehalose 6-phosphate phosphatase n=3 Tax=Streptomyces TaxID=1883 RepID=A0A8H9HRS7_9ACTN|nr:MULTISPECIES: trehalose-phosphatase [Streptomyces]MBL3805257.1 trehalose-phosphatase [Streptomyces sp. BRB081]MDQ0294056.1 trehalose 6-phosphate phosphatase [Streptomyces sp. DSM 41037]PJM82089.1 trehalose-phosphatase [Streptomyces sp. TSRI0384-2]QNE82495.1 trehalose-phosphatase [Streptomyces rutgersensis]RPK89377.1 Trehalose-6-phosphate phosphatase [Streptomyces sp. ADI98-12]
MASPASPSPLPLPDTAAGREGLEALLARPGEAVVGLDFDGTLAPIVSDPERAGAHADAVPALAQLAPLVRSVAVITGRPAEQAVLLGGFADEAGLGHLTVLGHYGAQRWDAATGELHTPEAPPGLAAARAELPAVLADAGDPPGSWTEDKGQAFAVHTRRADDPEGAFAALRGPLGGLADRHGLHLEPGRLVLEIRPRGVDKGVALTAYVEETGAGAVLYAGDDLGDLAAYDAVDRLRERGVPGLLVCSGDEVPELASRADLVVRGPGQVAALLAGIAETVRRSS